MGHRKAWIAGLIVSTAIVGCNGVPSLPLLSQTEPLAGQAYLHVPLDNAKIAFEAASGDPLATSSNGTVSQGRFFEHLSLTPPLAGQYAQWFSSNLPMTVKVTGGTVDGKAFDGTLMGYVDSFSPSSGLQVNILTTLIAKYKKAAGVTLEQAETAVKTALGIPADMDLASKLNDPNTWSRFNPKMFMTQAEANGGFDAFSDRVVANMATSQKAGFSFAPGNAAPGIGSQIGGFLLSGLGNGLISWGVNEVMGWIMHAFGYQNPTQQALTNIENELTTMNNTLTTIQNEIGTLTNEVSQLMQEVNLEWANLIATNDSMDMSGPEGIIKNQYGTMLTNFPASSPDLCTPAGNADATLFAQNILSPPDNNIDQQIYDMYQNITGQIVGSSGALYDITTQLIVQVQGGQDLLSCYYVLENYFGQLAAIQTQGLDLMIEALHQQNPTSIGSGTETASGYYTKFTNQMNQEVELFLYNVDRLVIASIDVRSEIAQKFAYLPTEAAAIYNRADFVANQLSSQQPSGLIVRLIGDPNSVSNWVANNQIQAAGQNLTLVSVNGNTTNNYPFAVPKTTPGATHYLTWTPNGNVYSLKKETNVSIVKLQYPTTTAGSFTVTTPTQTQTISVALLNGQFQPASPTDSPQVAYGSGVFYVRTLPTWQAGSATKTEDTHDQWGTYFAPDPADAGLGLECYPQELDWWRACPVTYTGEILTTICNGESTHLTLNINWNGTEKTSDTWGNRTNAPTAGGKQSLICQSTTQDPTSNGQAMTLKNVALEPNTNTGVYYKAQLQVKSGSSITNKVEYGDDVTTNAFLNSLEFIPQP